jgi:hypothetical protein
MHDGWHDLTLLEPAMEDVPTMKQYLEKDARGMNIFDRASEQQDMDTLRNLAKCCRGRLPDVYPLVAAAKNGNQELFELLERSFSFPSLNTPVKLSCRHACGIDRDVTILRTAAQSHNNDFLRWLLENHPQIDPFPVLVKNESVLKNIPHWPKFSWPKFSLDKLLDTLCWDHGNNNADIAYLLERGAECTFAENNQFWQSVLRWLTMSESEFSELVRTAKLHTDVTSITDLCVSIVLGHATPLQQTKYPCSLLFATACACFDILLFNLPKVLRRDILEYCAGVLLVTKHMSKHES